MAGIGRLNGASMPIALVAAQGSSLLLGYDNRFQHGEFAENFDLHGRPGLDAPVVARQMLSLLSVDRCGDMSTKQVCQEEPAQGYFVCRVASTVDPP